MMNRTLTVFVTFTVILGGGISGCNAHPRESAAASVTVGQIRAGSTDVIGKLGYPLGTILNIEAIVVAREGVPPTFPITYLLKVNKVNGVALSDAVVLSFVADVTSPVYVAPSAYELDQLLELLLNEGPHRPDGSGAIAQYPPISQEEAAAIREGILGSQHRLIAYESGKWDGAPENFPEEYGYLASRKPFALETFLVLIAEERSEIFPMRF